MNKLLASFFALLLSFGTAFGQATSWPPPAGSIAFLCVFNTVAPVMTNGQIGFVQCDANGNIKTSGGGGGGLSVTDQAAFTQASSSFTPGGGVFNDATTLSSGQQGTYRLTTKRAQIIDTDTTGNALYSAITGATPAGSNTVGNVKIVDTAGTNLATVKAASTAPIATDTSLVTALNPNSPGIITLGQTTKSASVPVTIASDQYIDPCQSPNVAKSSAVINITTAATTSLVAVSGATVVYVCGVSMTISEVITTPNTLLFEYGTGAACTGPVALTGKYGDGGVTAGIPIVVNASNGGTVFKSAASNGICALTTIGATASFQGVLTYVQQ